MVTGLRGLVVLEGGREDADLPAAPARSARDRLPGEAYSRNVEFAENFKS